MTIRGGGVPGNWMAVMPCYRLGPPPRSFAADAHGCIMVWISDPPNTSLWRGIRAQGELPSEGRYRTLLAARQLRKPIGFRSAEQRVAGCRPPQGRAAPLGAEAPTGRALDPATNLSQQSNKNSELGMRLLA